ncbi:MAG: hypothetical protein CSA70_01650 [Rhodobacterales bacterium]|nr:MAG: hypothetical protein CSA70_01650 [Rhodobacterales bacterium]
MTRLAKLAYGCTVLALVGGLSGCGKVRDRVQRNEFDGHKFRSSVQVDDAVREKFTIRVPNATRSLRGAREAGRHEANRYCIENYGDSEMVWVNGPDVEDSALVLNNDDLILRGECKGW